MSLNQSKTPTSKVPIFASSEYLSWCFEASQPGSPLAQVSSAATLLVSKVAIKIVKALKGNTILPGFGFSRNVQQVQNIFDAESLLLCWLYYSRYSVDIMTASRRGSSQFILYHTHIWVKIQITHSRKLHPWPNWSSQRGWWIQASHSGYCCWIGLLVPQVMSYYLLGTLRPPTYLDMLNLSSQPLERRKRPSLLTTPLLIISFAVPALYVACHDMIILYLSWPA